MVSMRGNENAIVFLRQSMGMMGYIAKRFMLEFTSKPWSPIGLKRLIKKIDETSRTPERIAMQ
jgi:hypothetical protein